MEETRSCASVIHEELLDELEKIRAFNAGPEHECQECGLVWHEGEDSAWECPDCGSEHFDTYNEDYPMIGFGRQYIRYRLEISWGGPADGFYIDVNPEDREIERITYYFQDWHDGAEMVLSGSDFDLAKDFFEDHFTFDG